MPPRRKQHLPAGASGWGRPQPLARRAASRREGAERRGTTAAVWLPASCPALPASLPDVARPLPDVARPVARCCPPRCPVLSAWLPGVARLVARCCPAVARGCPPGGRTRHIPPPHAPLTGEGLSSADMGNRSAEPPRPRHPPAPWHPAPAPVRSMGTRRWGNWQRLRGSRTRARRTGRYTRCR